LSWKNLFEPGLLINFDSDEEGDDARKGDELIMENSLVQPRKVSAIMPLSMARGDLDSSPDSTENPSEFDPESEVESNTEANDESEDAKV